MAVLCTAILVAARSIDSVPLPTSTETLSSWFAETSPAAGSLAVLRATVMALAAYALTVLLLELVGSVCPGPSVIRVRNCWVRPAVCRVLLASSGITVTAAASFPSVAAAATAGLPDEEAPVTVLGPATGDLEETTLTRLDEPEPDLPPTEPAEDPTVAAADTPPPAAEAWTVSAGDHLWQIAEETLVDHGSEAVSEDQITAYWLTLIEANRSRLVDPENPDLILPGQQLTLPAP